MTQYTLRHYQRDSVTATLQHFRQTTDPAVIVLPTGAGKSLVIAELARLAKGKVLVLAHVKELVAQNSEKYQSYGFSASIFSAGLQQKNTEEKVVFASIQSVSANLAEFEQTFSLLIIDECHRYNGDKDSQYGKVISQLSQKAPKLRILGLTATPYRLGYGWIYQTHYRGIQRSAEEKPFKKCIYELPLSYMIKHQFLTPAHLIDAPIASYDFDHLKKDHLGRPNQNEINQLLVKHPRVTRSIIDQIIQLSEDRKGVMIFAATVDHALEIMSYLPENSQVITGSTPQKDRDQWITAFKEQSIKFLVNVSVLTTGFDAPHVDVIAILRPTESLSLYQQIVGRGLRLSPDKSDCLVIDYAGNGYNIFHPEVGEPRPNKSTVPVQVFCPQCEHPNIFWGITDADGDIIEHFGRRCWGLIENTANNEVQCDYRFKFKECPQCNAQNDIAARQCHQCGEKIIDPDDQLKAALQLKDALVIRCAGMQMTQEGTKLTIHYYDEDGTSVKESFNMTNTPQRSIFNKEFGQRFLGGTQPKIFINAEQVINDQTHFTAPDFVIARKKGQFWRIQQKLFDYQGCYRKANQMA